MSNNELKRAVERAMEKRDRPSSHTLGVTTLAIADFDTIMNALSERAELMAAVERMRGALKPFAKAATLFDTGDYIYRDANIYRPGAGEEYYLNSGHLLYARAALTTGEEK